MNADFPPPYSVCTSTVSRDNGVVHPAVEDGGAVGGAIEDGVVSPAAPLRSRPSFNASAGDKRGGLGCTSLPPSYSDATCVDKLPTYDDVQQQSADNAQAQTNADLGRLWRLPTVINNLDSQQHDLSLSDDQILGTDLTFLAAFLVSFLFNWVGFLALLCFCQSVAARYGALAGFGLSLAKWTLIVKNNTTFVSHDNLWIWWLIMAFGLVICARAMLQYFYIKREWQSLSDTTRRRLVLFY